MATFVADAITFNTTAGNKTVAITPAVGDLLIVIAANTGTTTDPTITDDRGGTYTRIAAADAIKNASADEMHFYVRDAPCQLAVSHTLTMNVGGAGTGGGAWVARIAGMAKFGANAVRQATKQDNQALGGTPTATFTLPILTESLTIFACFNAGTAGSVLANPVNYNERQDVGYTVPAAGLEIATRDSGQTGLTITANGTSGTAFCTIGVELDVATPTNPGSGRFDHPGQPQEMMRRRLPFPAQDFTNTSVSGPVTETPTFGGAVASGRTPSPTVAVANAGSIAGGAGPSANAVISQAGSPASGFAPGANATVAQGSSTGSGRTPAPQVTPSLGSALGQGTGPVAIVSVTSQGATASGNPPTAVETVSFGGATASGAAPSPQVILTPGGALGQGVQPTASAVATPTQGQGIASGNSPSPQAIPSQGSSVGQGASPSPTTTPSQGSSVGQGQGPGADATAGQGGSTSTGTGPVAVVVLSPGSSIGGGFTPTDSTGTAETPTFGGATASGNSPNPTVATTSQGASGSGTGPSPTTVLTPGSSVGQGAAPGTSSTPGQGGSSGDGTGPVAVVTVTSQGATASGNSPFPTVGVSIGGSIAGGNPPTEYHFETPSRGGATGSGNAPGANATSAIGSSTASGNTPSPTATLTPGASTGQGTGPGTSSTADPGAGSGEGTGPTAVVGVSPGGAVTDIGLPEQIDSDDFNRPDSASLGAPWASDGNLGEFTIASNELEPDGVGVEFARAYLGAALPDDQYAEITLTSLTSYAVVNGGAGLGLTLRHSQDAFLFWSNYYKATFSTGASGNINISRYDNGSYTNLAFFTAALSDGDTVRFEAVGDLLSVYVNGSLVGSTTDATYTSGYAGVGYSAGNTIPTGDNWSAGAVHAAPVITAVVTLSPGGAVAGGNAPTAPLQEQANFGGSIAGGNSPSSDASVDLGGSATSSGGVNVYVTLGPGGAIAGYFPPTEIGVTPPAPTGPTPGSGGAKRVQSIHNRIEPDRRVRDEEEEEALLLISLSLE